MSTHYRTQVRIVADVLKTARDLDNDGEGVGITTLLRRANLSYSRLAKIVHNLVFSGLLIEYEEKKGSRYRISGKGLQFLSTYDRFEEFAQSFGLRL